MKNPSERLPIFPLSNVVLFPRVLCPLHLFEPRYRQLAEHALRGERRIGMVVVPQERAADMAGDPPVYPIGCVGTIAQSNRLPDGRYNIVLMGSGRFRITGEPPRDADQLFRTADVVALEDPYDPQERERVGKLRTRVLDLLGRLVDRSAGSDGFSPEPFRELDDESCVNALCNALQLAPDEKQALLEADGVLRRYEQLDGLLSFHLAAPSGASRGPSSRIH